TVDREPPSFETKGGWQEILKEPHKSRLTSVLGAYTRTQRWFGGKARPFKQARIVEWVPLPNDAEGAIIVFLEIGYIGGENETYLLPLAYVPARRALDAIQERPETIIARIRITKKAEEGFLLDAPADARFCRRLMDLIRHRRQGKGETGEIVGHATAALQQIPSTVEESSSPSLLQSEQSNTSILYGDRLILKLFRRLHEGVNPDLQIGRYLTERGFAHAPPVAGFIEYRRSPKRPETLAILMGYIRNQGNAWEYTVNLLDRYFETIAARGSALETAPLPQGGLVQLALGDPPDETSQPVGLDLSAARTLGARTAGMHLALAQPTEDPEFTPVRFTRLYQRSLYQSMRAACRRNVSLLRRRLAHLPDAIRPDALRLTEAEPAILATFRRLLDIPISGLRTRCHGDYHLGQVLHTGRDFVIIDFEGEPARPLSERLIKRSPLRDVAGMLRSFHYATSMALQAAEKRGWLHPDNRPLVHSWAEYWYQWMGAIFLKEYIGVAGQGQFLPSTDAERQVLLDSYLLDKAIYELGYELDNRPDWVAIPVTGILHVLELRD
ncbi:MAG: putative maltokinase, partial [Desulfosarcina sp.]